MLMKKIPATMLIAAIALAGAGAAQAHARLVSASPAAGSVGPSPAQIRLTFSEALEPKFSGFDLEGADSAKIGIAVAPDPKDAKVLVGTVKARLPAGGYRIGWHAVSRDGHRTTGSISFTVR